MDYRTGRIDACYWEKPLSHTERCHPGRHSGFLESTRIGQALHPWEFPADKVQVTCSFPSHNERQALLQVLLSEEPGTKETVPNAF